MKRYQLILCLVTSALIWELSTSVFGQTETFDVIQYSPPSGWTKTVKEGALVYSSVDKSKNTFCVLTIYRSTVSSGSPQKDFSNEWNELVVKPFKAAANPKTDLQPTADGWQATVGGSQIDLDGGAKAAAVLTVFTGFERTASIFVIFNDEAFLTQASALIDGVKLDKAKALAAKDTIVPSKPNTSSPRDPFPDKPGRAAQKPLAGTLKESITMADLAGTWDEGGASVTTYVDAGSGNYAGTDTTFYAQSYAIKANGTFDHRFTGRTSNHTVREVSNGVITLSGGFIIVKFTGGERKTTSKYQFVSFMTLPNGGAVLSLIPLGENSPLYDGNWMNLECGHGSGYIHCVGGEEWVVRVAK